MLVCTMYFTNNKTLTFKGKDIGVEVLQPLQFAANKMTLRKLKIYVSACNS